MFNIFFDKASQLHAQDEPFALATVVRFEAPNSGKPGDKAIIKADGTLEGWIGGGCAQPLVIKEAQRALKDGKPRFLRIAAESGTDKNGMVVYPMTCHSGGELDVFIEPVFPKPHMVILGHSVVAQTLCRLALAIHYRVTVLAPEMEVPVFPDTVSIVDAWDLGQVNQNANTFLVVATQGEGDEQAMHEVLNGDWAYVAFVASRKKADAVFDILKAEGADASKLDAISVPAGIDIKARLPEEIAVSILAEIILIKQNLAAYRTPEEATAVDQHMVAEQLSIEHMSCAHCVSTVEKTLKKLDGVVVGEVEIGTAAIQYDPALVERSDIVAAIEGKGYAVVAHPGEVIS